MINRIGVTNVKCDFPFYSKDTKEDIVLPSSFSLLFEPIDYSTFPLPKNISSLIQDKLIKDKQDFGKFLAEQCINIKASGALMSVDFMFPYKGKEYPMTLSFEFRKGRLKRQLFSITVENLGFTVLIKLNFSDTVYFEDIIDSVEEAIEGASTKQYSWLPEVIVEELTSYEDVEWYHFNISHNKSTTIISERKVVRK